MRFVFWAIALVCVASNVSAQQRPSAPAHLQQTAQRGPENAPVTVVLFTDFECPYCARTSEDLKKLLDEHSGDVRLLVKNFPLRSHTNAPMMHEASLAAGSQGKYWEMYELLYAQKLPLASEDVLRLASQLHLDVARFRADLDAHTFSPSIARDQAEGVGLGVRVTPTIFINGLKFEGYQSYAKLSGVIEQQLRARRGTEQEVAASASKLSDAVAKVEIGSSPVRGDRKAPVSIIEFADVQCPFCEREVGILRELMDAYPGKISWTFKNYPLDFHRDSALAHRALLAASSQNKFWEMHDILMASPRALKREDLVRYAGQLHLDVAKFSKDIDSEELQAQVDVDRLEGERLGVSGTPTLFINGKQLVGAQTLAELRRIVDDELRFAKSVDAVSAVNAQQAKPEIDATMGPANAPVTVLWYADLGSSLTRNTLATLRKLNAIYPDKVRLEFRSGVLGVYANSAELHEAVMAAAAQNKFWQMLDAVANSPKKLTSKDLADIAGSIGLDKAKFESDLNAHAFGDLVASSMREAREADIRGTPAFVINGKRLDGLQSLEQLRKAVEEAVSTSAKVGVQSAHGGEALQGIN